MANYLSADPIAHAGGGFEPQRKNNWTFRCAPPTGGGRLLALTLDAMDIPKSTTAPIGLDFGNERRFVAGKTTFSDQTLTIKDFIDQDSQQLIDDWRNAVYDPETGKIGLASEYKVDSDFLMFGPNGQVVRRWRLVGVWPMEVGPGGGDMAASGDGAANKVQVTFKIDKMVYQGKSASNIDSEAPAGVGAFS